MTMSDNSSPDKSAFRARPAELASIIKHHLGFSCNALSPLTASAESKTENTEESLRVAEHTDFRTAAAILANPQIRITHYKGGGSSSVTEVFSVYACAEGQGEGLVSLHTTTDQANLLIYFPSLEAYLDWWIETCASNAFWPSDNLIDEIVPLEKLVVILHSIDCYQRAHLESKLRYSSEVGSAITAEGFGATLQEAVAGRDKRWLLPCFLAFGLGQEKSGIELRAEDTSAAIELDFLKQESDAEHGQYFSFGSSAIRMGDEFRTSWLSSIGCEAIYQSSDGIMRSSRVFLAPTANSNHLFFCLPNQQGTLDFSHHALSAGDLKLTLRQWLESMSVLASAQQIASPVQSPENVLPTAKFCTDCGHDNQLQARFCRKCGHPFN